MRTEKEIVNLLKNKYNIKCTLGCFEDKISGRLSAIAYTAKQADRWCEKLHGTWCLEQGAYIVSWKEN